jgi:regulatory protein
MRPEGRNKAKLDSEKLERLGLFYAGRYATSRARLAAYLNRKLRERGWEGDAPPPVEALVERFAALGYVDDLAFASGRAAALARRGYGERRLDQALKAAGIGAEAAAPALKMAEEGAEAAALRFARRRRLGPFAVGPMDHEARRRAVAAMLRAGHRIEIVRKILDAGPADVPDPDLD